MERVLKAFFAQAIIDHMRGAGGIKLTCDDEVSAPVHGDPHADGASAQGVKNEIDSDQGFDEAFAEAATYAGADDNSVHGSIDSAHTSEHSGHASNKIGYAASVQSGYAGSVQSRFGSVNPSVVSGSADTKFISERSGYASVNSAHTSEHTQQASINSEYSEYSGVSSEYAPVPGGEHSEYTSAPDGALGGDHDVDGAVVPDSHQPYNAMSWSIREFIN